MPIRGEPDRGEAPPGVPVLGTDSALLEVLPFVPCGLRDAADTVSDREMKRRQNW
jgi:hypothetical protein